jgi:hypothetical protein
MPASSNPTRPRLGSEVSLLLKLPGFGSPLQVGGRGTVAPGTETGTLEAAVCSRT